MKEGNHPENGDGQQLVAKALLPTGPTEPWYPGPSGELAQTGGPSSPTARPSSTSLAVTLGERCMDTLLLGDFPLFRRTRIGAKSSTKSASSVVLRKGGRRKRTVQRLGALNKNQQNQLPISDARLLAISFKKKKKKPDEIVRRVAEEFANLPVCQGGSPLPLC